MFVVFTELFDNGFERWYYGTYETRDRANKVAYELGAWHGICPLAEAEEWGVKNLPR